MAGASRVLAERGMLVSAGTRGRLTGQRCRPGLKTRRCSRSGWGYRRPLGRLATVNGVQRRPWHDVLRRSAALRRRRPSPLGRRARRNPSPGGRRRLGNRQRRERCASGVRKPDGGSTDVARLGTRGWITGAWGGVLRHCVPAFVAAAGGGRSRVTTKIHATRWRRRLGRRRRRVAHRTAFRRRVDSHRGRFGRRRLPRGGSNDPAARVSRRTPASASRIRHRLGAGHHWPLRCFT